MHRRNWMARCLGLIMVAFLMAPATLAALEAEGAGTPDALLQAADRGDLAGVKKALAAGAPLEARDAYGGTAVNLAARNGHLEVVRFLLDRGANPDVADSFYGATPMGWALMKGHTEVALLLLKRGAEGREQVLGMGASTGQTDLVEAAIESGPIYESVLTQLRAAPFGEEIKALLAKAESRPDPPPPTYDAAALQAFAGSFEGTTSDTRVDVRERDGRLLASIDGGDELPLTVTGDKQFRAAEAGVDAVFFGRAGGIEGIQLVRPGAAPVALRRSVAEPVGVEGLKLPTTAEAPREATVHWPSFRGPNATGIGDGAEPPVAWDLESGDGVLWRDELPGLGHSSPVIWGDRLFVTSAVAEEIEQTLSTGLTGAFNSVPEDVLHHWVVYAYDKTSGKRLWETEIGKGVPLTERHFKASQANSTPVTDGKHVVVVFPTAGLACLDMEGKVLWKKELGGLNAGAFNDPSIEWGFAASPILHDGRVILQVDVHGGQYLAAWKVETGELVWKTERDVAPSWATPAILPTPAGDQLVVNGSTIHGYDAATGKELWSLGPNSELVIAAPVVGDGVVYVSAGYPPVKPIYAIPAGLRGDLEVDPRGNDPRLRWSAGIGGAYMPTPLLYRGLYYVVHHNGRLVAYEAASGKAIYKKRFSEGGTFTASPIAANGKIYATTEEGQLYILAAGPEYEEIALHEFAEPLMATPAVSEGILYLRTPSRLIALGRAPEKPAASEAAGAD